MLTAAQIEREVAEGYGDDSLIPEIGKAPAWFDEHPGKLPQPDGSKLEIASFAPVEFAPVHEADRVAPPPAGLVDSELLTAAYAWRTFPMGGWVYHGVTAWMQREDQGQDYEVPLGHHTIAPSWGKCIHHLTDHNWPGGFGSPYAVVYIGGPCNFKGKFWYIGHNNGTPIIPVGEWFHSEQVLATPNHSMNYGRGWTELGHAPNGYPGSWGEGAANHWRFAPVRKWSAH